MEEGGEASQRVCVICKEHKKRDAFSKKQWLAKAHSRKCNACIEEELKALIQGIVFADPTASLKRCTREVAAKYKSLGRPAPSAADVKAAWVLLGLDKQDDDSLIQKFYTIGVNPTVKSVPGPEDKEFKEHEKPDGVWYPIELDVPMDRTGKHTYGALMNFNRKKTGEQRAALGEIFKIQVAADAPPNSPMLMYNQTRSKRTFIHADAPGYREIGEAVSTHGVQGVLATAGGTKAFLYGQYDRKRGVVFILASELAESQPW